MEEGGKLSSLTSFLLVLFGFGFFFYSKVCVAKWTVNCGRVKSSQGKNCFFSDSRLVDSV